ncbi:RING finger protein 37 [Topomyia yanbarensis]|uniref:RING finger protein 37 n=1 Tax=Topomyia yanbarensis TaxID=2498891 RepID=UPI00273CE89D|nr:RING finger protein 37 [Topomyia yanbarensis]
MINFLSHKLQPNVHTDAVEDDCHPVGNLISSNQRELDRGFMAYSVTKPPVEIIFKLFCPIAVKNIKIWPQIGALKSTSVEIYAQNKRGAFDKLGYGESQHAEVMEFADTRIETCTSPDTSRGERFVLFPTMKHLISNSSVFKIIIRKTAKCAPVLRKIEIWGEPSRSCSETIKSEVHQMWYERNEVSKNDSMPPSEKIVTETTITDVPEEFLDELTCDIMTIPMILPSGKVVDQYTIEKHNAQEEKWGRQPSDPFTGLLYNAMRKPMFSAALKARIDNFIIKHANSDKFQYVPRTVGSNLQKLNNSHLHPISKRQKLNTEPAILNLSCTTLEAAVRKALATTTRYTLPPTTANEPSEVCRNCMRESECLYQINSCKHIICRNCLKSQAPSSTIIICTCGVEFEKRFVERYHSR